MEGAARIPHVAALDGLRGVAVIGVLLFHADHLQGGFLGVDLFFTLSGFLITSLLLVERERTGAISLRRFWGRRLRRLLPALVLVVVAAAVLGPAVLPSGELDRFRTQALATLAYVANWTEVARAGDYFALFEAPTPLDHVWSLAIEEQFYVVWPLLVVAVARLGRPRAAVRFLAMVGICASLVASWWVLRDADGITRAYFGTDTRAASILIGAALATLTVNRARTPGPLERGAGALAPLALVALVASWLVVDGTERWLYGPGFAVHAVLTGVVVAAVSGPAPGTLGRVLASRALVRAGLLSYGLYLWHWPVYVALDEARTGVDGWALTALRLAVSVPLAEISFRLVESPIRNRRVRLPAPGASALAAMAACALVVVLVVRPPAPAPLPPVPPLTPTTLQSVDGPGPAPAEPTEPTVSSVVLVGDSQAFTLAFLAPAGEMGLRVDNAANLGCGISARDIVVHGDRVARAERCAPVLAELGQQVDDADADVVAVLAGVWESADQITDDGVVPFGDPRWAELIRTDFLAAVQPLAVDHQVVVLTTPCFAPGAQRDEYATEDLDARIAAVNEVFEEAAAELGARVVDLAAHLCPDGRPRSEIDGYVVRPDGVHFDEVGARVVWPWLAEQLRAALDPER